MAETSTQQQTGERGHHHHHHHDGGHSHGKHKHKHKHKSSNHDHRPIIGEKGLMDYVQMALGVVAVIVLILVFLAYFVDDF